MEIVSTQPANQWYFVQKSNYSGSYPAIKRQLTWPVGDNYLGRLI